jgi:hypothetical protein
MRTRTLLAACCLALLALPAIAAEPSMQVPGKNPWELVAGAVGVAWSLFLIIFPTAVALARKERNALELLLAAIPRAWDVVQQERRRAAKTSKMPLSAEEKINQDHAVTNATARALEIVAAIAPKELTKLRDGKPVLKTPELVTQATVAIQAHHERMHAIGATATPVLPLPVAPRPTTPVASTPFVAKL